MKRLLPIAILSIFLVTEAVAQNVAYQFSHFTSAYVPLSQTGQNVFYRTFYASWNTGIPINIPFVGFGNPVNAPYTHNIECVTMNSTGNSDQFVVRALGSNLVLDYTNGGGDYISCIVTGTAPNRIFKVEYDTVNFSNELPSLTSNISFQVWFLEADSSVEFHYGPLNWVTGHTLSDVICPAVQWFDYASSTLFGYTLTGDPANPVLDSTGACGLTWFPAENTVYRFKPNIWGQGSSVANITNNDGIKTAYDHFSKKVSVSAENEKIEAVRVYNAVGQSLKLNAETGQAGKTVIDLSTLPLGIYILHIKTDRGEIVRKIENN